MDFKNREEKYYFYFGLTGAIIWLLCGLIMRFFSQEISTIEVLRDVLIGYVSSFIFLASIEVFYFQVRSIICRRSAYLWRIFCIIGCIAAFYIAFWWQSWRGWPSSFGYTVTSVFVAGFFVHTAAAFLTGRIENERRNMMYSRADPGPVGIKK